MERQLVLLPDEDGSRWRLDEETKDRGRRGVAAARAVLAATRPTAA